MDTRSAIKAVGAIVMAVIAASSLTLNALGVTEMLGLTVDLRRWLSVAAFIGSCGFIWWTKESSFVRDYKLTLGGLEKLSEEVANSP